MKEFTITQVLETMGSIFCDNYCKFCNEPVPEGKTEDWLFEDDDSPCNNCPINFI